MRLKELCFYMEGNTPMVRVIHALDTGVHEAVTSPASELGNINGITVKLAEAVVKRVKENAR